MKVTRAATHPQEPSCKPMEIRRRNPPRSALEGRVPRPGGIVSGTGARARPGPRPASRGAGAGGASAPAGRHRVRDCRPRTTGAKAALAAVAAVGATGLALALVAGPAGASTKPVWSMTAGNVQSLSAMDAGTTSYFFNTSRSYGAGASLVKTPVQRRYAT